MALSPLLVIALGLAASAGDASSAGAPSCSAKVAADGLAGSTLDVFDEVLHIQPLPSTASSSLFFTRFEFVIRAPLSASFRADQFDLFPKPIGKLLNAHRALTGFQVALTQGRWKDEWGPPPHEFRPPGAVLVAATEGSSEQPVVDEAWRFLISALSGSLCGSFEGMDPDHTSLAWVVPLDVPWAEEGHRLRFASLPYEPVCTENLTPWLKLLPCGRHRGLAALTSPLAIAEAPLVSLMLDVSMDEGSSSMVLRTSLDVVLPRAGNLPGFGAWFGRGIGDGPAACPAASSSKVVFTAPLAQSQAALNHSGAELMSVPGGSDVLVFSSTDFAQLTGSANTALAGKADGPSRLKDSVQGLSVMRDILSQQGRSERTHGRYLLRFTNPSSVGKRVRFMDQLPFFTSPMWHTFHATLEDPAAGKALEELHGLDAMRRLSVHFVSPSRPHDPTQLFLAADVPPGGVVSVFLDVLKNFIQLREFSYACEKGFDVSAAAWMEVDLPQKGDSSGVGDFVRSLAPSEPWKAPSPDSRWRLRFTQGLLILVPMPDFSMPFNVIALSATALTFFFGSIFRLTAAGRLPHWVMKKEGVEPVNKWNKISKMLLRGLALGAVAGSYCISQLAPKDIQEFNIHLEPLGLPPDVVDQIIQFLLHVRETGTKLGL